MNINNLTLPSNIGRSNEETINIEPAKLNHNNRHRHKKYKRSSWAINNTGIRTLWGQGLKGKGSKVCIIDTGVNSHHVELHVSASHNFTNTHSVNDTDGHGSHTAGTCSGRNIKADIGVAPESSLYIAKVFDDRGETSLTSLANAIKWGVTNHVDVISMSLGGDGDIPMYLARAIGLAIENNVLVIVAAGNSGPYRNTIEEPGNFTPCVTVGAVMSNNKVAGFSSRGSQIDIVAPGVNILSSYKGSSNTYCNLSGTSMATPFVAGVACLFVQKARSVGLKYNQQLFERLVKDTAIDLGPRGFDMDYGAGLINPIKLIATVDKIAKPSPHKNIKSHNNNN